MRKILLTIFVGLSLLFLVPGSVFAQVCSIQPDEWSIFPADRSPGETFEIELNETGFIGSLWVVINPYSEPVSNTFKAEHIFEAPLVVNPPGSARQSYTLPQDIPNGSYDIILFRTLSFAEQCSGGKTLTISGGEDAPEDPVGCLSVDDPCLRETPDLDLPLCDPLRTYCKQLDFLTGYSAVQPRGQLLSACLHTGEQYTCDSGEPSSQDESCLCQPQITPSYDTSLVISTGCKGGKGYVSSAIGCIPYLDSNALTSFFLKWSLGVGGGIALFLIVLSAIKIMATQGDPKKLQDARDSLSSAIAGLVLIILSVYVLRAISEALLTLF